MKVEKENQSVNGGEMSFHLRGVVAESGE